MIALVWQVDVVAVVASWQSDLLMRRHQWECAIVWRGDLVISWSMSFGIAGAFSRMRGCTPSTASQWAVQLTPFGSVIFSSPAEAAETIFRVKQKRSRHLYVTTVNAEDVEWLPYPAARKCVADMTIGCGFSQAFQTPPEARRHCKPALDARADASSPYSSA